MLRLLPALLILLPSLVLVARAVEPAAQDNGPRPPVKLTEAWLPPRSYSSYFYFFAYDHAARAIADHGTSAARRRSPSVGRAQPACDFSCWSATV